MKFLFLFLFLLTTQAFGATCKKLSECIEAGHSITGQKYIYDKKIVPFTFELNEPLELNRNNVEKNLSEALALFGLVRVPTRIEKTSKIIQARDLKFHNDLPTVRASKNALPKIQETKDPLSVIYKTTPGADVEVIAGYVEPLLSRYGKVDPLRDGSIIVTDTAQSLVKILPLLEKQDFPLTKEEKAKIELSKKREHELELARLKSGELHEIGPHKHKHD